MNKIFKVLMISMFLTGFMASAICLSCGRSPVVQGCCHSQAPAGSSRENDCFIHCQQQKILAVNLENQALAEPKGQSQSFKVAMEAIELPEARPYFKPALSPLLKPMIRLDAGQNRFTPLLNHAPPFFPLQ